MSCTSPLYRVPEDCLSYRLLSHDDKKRLRNGGVFFFDLRAVERLASIPGFNRDDVQVIPCGYCESCRLNNAKEWAIRCALEAERHEHNYFVTLTYDDVTLPRGEFIDYEGNIFDSTLQPRDVQLFLKSLREWERTVNNNTGVRVFYCGEYGGRTGRPHYHLCLFGVSEIPDLVYSFTRGSFKYYKSKKYESFWNVKLDGVKVLRGFVDITELTFDCAAYTARYCLKKQKGLPKKNFLSYYDSLDEDERLPLRTDCFVRMSNRPGIAADYALENKDQIMSEDLVKYHKKYQLFKSKPPRYFSKLFEREDPEAFAELKSQRISAGILANKSKLLSVSEVEEARLKREADIVSDRIKKYHRRDNFE